MSRSGDFFDYITFAGSKACNSEAVRLFARGVLDVKPGQPLVYSAKMDRWFKAGWALSVAHVLNLYHLGQSRAAHTSLCGMAFDAVFRQFMRNIAGHSAKQSSGITGSLCSIALLGMQMSASTFFVKRLINSDSERADGFARLTTKVLPRLFNGVLASLLLRRSSAPDNLNDSVTCMMLVLMFAYHIGSPLLLTQPLHSPNQSSDNGNDVELRERPRFFS